MKHKNGVSFPVLKWGDGHCDWRIHVLGAIMVKMKVVCSTEWSVPVSTGQQCFCPRRHNSFTLLIPCGRALCDGANLAPVLQAAGASKPGCVWLCYGGERWQVKHSRSDHRIWHVSMPCRLPKEKCGRQRNFDSFSTKTYCLHSGPDIFPTRRLMKFVSHNILNINRFFWPPFCQLIENSKSLYILFRLIHLNSGNDQI